MRLVSRDYQHCLLKKAYQHYDRCSLMAKCSVLWCLHLWLSLDSEVTSYELFFFDYFWIQKKHQIYLKSVTTTRKVDGEDLLIHCSPFPSSP